MIQKTETMGNFLDNIIDGVKLSFDTLYLHFKKPYIAYFTGWSLPFGETPESIYHLSCAVLLENIQKGRLAKGSVPDEKMLNYLIRIGKYTISNKKRNRQPDFTCDVDPETLDQRNAPLAAATDESEEAKEKDARLFVARASVRDMPEHCFKILCLYYYDNKSHKEIAEQMHLSGEDSSKSQKSSCMKALKEKAAERLKKMGYGKD